MKLSYMSVCYQTNGKNTKNFIIQIIIRHKNVKRNNIHQKSLYITLIISFYISLWNQRKKCKAILENKRLISLRDELLPLLMNGQVSLNSYLFDKDREVYSFYSYKLVPSLIIDVIRLIYGFISNYAILVLLS